MKLFSPASRRSLLCVLLVSASVASASAQSAGRDITLQVDLTDASRKLVHARETMAVAPGPLTLVFPKWIPGEHGPTGPIEDMAGFTISARAADGKPCAAAPQNTAAAPQNIDGRLKWERDPVEMYAFHLTVPQGCPQLQMTLDFLATAPPSGFSAGASTSENLALLSWNTVVVSPSGVPPTTVTVKPSVVLPSAWQFGTALKRANANAPVSSGPTYTTAFEPVPLDQLIDSPLLAGKYFKEIELASDVTPKHYLDIAADGPEQLAISASHIDEFSRLVREAGALYASRHYSDYHFLVTLSDSVAHFGLEHHQSSDDRIPGKTFIEDDRFVLAGDLLPHEFIHSWNGKYRRPAGLATGNYESPMVGDLLWVYEGLTQYFGDVLATRSGIWTQEQFLGHLALVAANLDHEPGRNWRDLQDTARMAQVLYDAGGGWDNWRRGTDFYAEGELVWLDVDTTVRKLTDGRKSLNDFAAAFEGLGGNTLPKVVPYTFDDVVKALNAIAPYDWAAFFRTRLDSNEPHAPLGGIEAGGYKLTYTPNQTTWGAMLEQRDTTVDFWFSLGLRVNAQDQVTDVLKGGPADKAGLGPGMHILAVNGRAFTPWVLRSAVHDSEGNGPTVELIVENTGYYKVIPINDHGGERYPTLERTSGTPDRLGDILKPMVK